MYSQRFYSCLFLVLLAFLAVTQVVFAAPRSVVTTLAMTVPTQAPAPEEPDIVLHKRWKGPPLGFKCWARANCKDCPPKSDFKAPNGEWKTIRDPRGGLIFLFIDEVGMEYICESPQTDDRPKPYCKDTVTERVVNGKIIRTHTYDLNNLPRGERNKLEAIRNGTRDGRIPEAEAKKLIKAFIARVCAVPGQTGGNGTMPTTTEHLVIGTGLATLVPEPTPVPTFPKPEPTAVPTFTMPQPPPPEAPTVPSTRTVIRTDVSTVTETHKPIVPSTSTVIQTEVSTITTTHTPIVPSTSTVIETEVSTLTTTHTPSMTTTTKTYKSIVTETHVPIPPITITLTRTAPSGTITVTQTKTEKETTSDLWTTVTLTRPRRPGTVITTTLKPSVITTTLSPSVVTSTLHSGASVITTTFDTEAVVITSTVDPEAWGTVSTNTLGSGAAPTPTEESRVEELDRGTWKNRLWLL